MTPAETVALDALRELGLRWVTVHHLRSLEAYYEALCWPAAFSTANDRLLSDLAHHSLETLHADALSMDKVATCSHRLWWKGAREGVCSDCLTGEYEIRRVWRNLRRPIPPTR